MARKLSHNFRTGMAPRQIALGRADTLSSMETRNKADPIAEDSEVLNAQEQIAAIACARNAIMIADANRAIHSSIHRPIRNCTREFFAIDDTVSIYQRIGKELKPRWNFGYRTVCAA